MQWKLPFVLWTMKSSNSVKSTATDVPTAVPAAQPISAQELGIEVIEIANKDTGQPEIAIQIRPIQCFKFFVKWMKQYDVAGTLKEWAASIDWNAQVWTPLKDWSKEQDWDNVKREVRDGLDKVDWKQMRKDARDEMKKVDWKEVRRDVKESLKETNWREVRQQIQEGMDQVDWKQVKQEVTEVADTIGVKAGLSEFCPESVKDEVGNVDWKQIEKSVRELCPDDLASSGLLTDDIKEAMQHVRDLCPEELECEQMWQFVEEATQHRDGKTSEDDGS